MFSIMIMKICRNFELTAKFTEKPPLAYIAIEVFSIQFATHTKFNWFFVPAVLWLLPLCDAKFEWKFLVGGLFALSFPLFYKRQRLVNKILII